MGATEDAASGRAARPHGTAAFRQSLLQGVADGTRTHDHLDHNQGLYQLSYRHLEQGQDSGVSSRRRRSSSTDSNTAAAPASRSSCSEKPPVSTQKVSSPAP